MKIRPAVLLSGLLPAMLPLSPAGVSGEEKTPATGIPIPAQGTASRKEFFPPKSRIAELDQRSAVPAAEPPPQPAAQAPPQKDGPNGHRLVMVPGGSYAVGSAESRMNPARTVKLESYAIATRETTNAQFSAFVAATGFVSDAEKQGTGKVALEGMADWKWDQIEGAQWRRPMGPRGPSWEDLKDHPVTQISGADAEAYCRWLGARLPTLDEWEAAARAGTSTLYPWGKDYDPKKANTWDGRTHFKNTRLDGFVYTAPVGSFPANAWGLHDVIGNVFEYCSGIPAGMSPKESAPLIAGRGGSWWCSAGTCHFFNLTDIGQMDRRGSLSNQGFRVVLEPSALKPVTK